MIYGLSGLQKQAITPVAGFPLVNGTPTILSWAVPNDGALHTFMLAVSMIVYSDDTGGAIAFSVNYPDGSAVNWNVFPADIGEGTGFSDAFPALVVQAGSTVALEQTSALTGGAATLWAEIWGS